jgi:hypothetical protein
MGYSQPSLGTLLARFDSYGALIAEEARIHVAVMTG